MAIGISRSRKRTAIRPRSRRTTERFGTSIFHLDSRTRPQLSKRHSILSWQALRNRHGRIRLSAWLYAPARTRRARRLATRRLLVLCAERQRADLFSHGRRMLHCRLDSHVLTTNRRGCALHSKNRSWCLALAHDPDRIVWTSEKVEATVGRVRLHRRVPTRTRPSRSGCAVSIDIPRRGPQHPVDDDIPTFYVQPATSSNTTTVRDVSD